MWSPPHVPLYWETLLLLLLWELPCTLLSDTWRGQYHQVAESVFVDNAAIAFVIFPEALSQVPIPGNILAIMFFLPL
jgi:hypothetical protein